jgi:transcriptional regulator with XRE-family HTH domain
MAIGQNIAEMRKARDLTQRELADKLGVSQSHIARWETERSQPRSKALDSLAEIFEITVEELLSGGSENLKTALEIEDKELLGLLKELRNLSGDEIHALKTVIRGLLARSRIEQSLSA